MISNTKTTFCNKKTFKPHNLFSGNPFLAPNQADKSAKNWADCAALKAYTDLDAATKSFRSTFRCDDKYKDCQDLQNHFLLWNMQLKHAFQINTQTGLTTKLVNDDAYRKAIEKGGKKTIKTHDYAKEKEEGDFLYHGQSGMCFNFKSLKDHNGKMRLTFTGPVSWSYDVKRALHFAGTFGFVLKAKLDGSEIGYNPASVYPIANFDYEKEILLYNVDNLHITQVFICISQAVGI